MGVSKERQKELRDNKDGKTCEEIIFWANKIKEAGGGKTRITANWEEVEWWRPFAACQKEARKLTAAGYGKVRFGCPILDERKARKSPRRERLSGQVERSVPFILDEKRGWVK